MIDIPLTISRVHFIPADRRTESLQ